MATIDDRRKSLRDRRNNSNDRRRKPEDRRKGDNPPLTSSLSDDEVVQIINSFLQKYEVPMRLFKERGIL